MVIKMCILNCYKKYSHYKGFILVKILFVDFASHTECMLNDTEIFLRYSVSY